MRWGIGLVKGWLSGRCVLLPSRLLHLVGIHIKAIGVLILVGWYRFSADQPRPSSPLDCIKFVCKDLWMRVFRKQIDNLKTNHRGTFVLIDSRFQPLSRMSVDRRLGPKGVDDAVNRAQAVSHLPSQKQALLAVS